MSRVSTGYALILKALLAKPCTIHDMMRVSGLHRDTVTRFIRVLRKAPRQLRVCDHKLGLNGAPTINVYELSTASDAARPRARTSAERQRALKQRQKQQAIAALTTAWNRPTNELGICDCENENDDQASAPEAAVLRASDV